MQLYENIRKRRNELKMTQTELALKTGYSDKSMIAKIEKGYVDIPISKIIEFANALHISAGDLMGNPPPESLPHHSDPLFEKIDRLDNVDRIKTEGYVDNLLEADKYKTPASETAS